MLSKCIGIISYFPDGDLGNIRREKFKNLLNTLDNLFNLPIIIVAQNWKDSDKKLYYGNKVTIYSYQNKLGITKARIILRDKLLSSEYEYYILIDDDINLSGNKSSAEKYLREIDLNPNKVGLFNGSHLQLVAVSRLMMNVMDFDYIKNLEAEKGDIWEDIAWIRSYRNVFPNRFFTFSGTGLQFDLIPSEVSDDSTWYTNDINQSIIFRSTKNIISSWTNLIKEENKWNLL